MKESDTKGKWWVNIPILNGIPDSESEGKALKDIYDDAVKINSKKEESKREKPHAIVKQSYEKWDNRLDKFQGYDNKGNKVESWDPIWNDLNQYEAEFFMEASVCSIGGVSNIIHIGDIVIVGFEDNDMGKPIILGHLLTDSLNTSTYYDNESRSFPSLKLGALGVKESVTLPSNTTFTLPTGKTVTMADLSELLNFYKSFNDAFSIPSTSSTPGTTGITNLFGILEGLKANNKEGVAE